MNSTNSISYYFRKYALLRVACLLFFIAIGFSIYFIVTNRTKPAPVIEKVEPPVGAPGDVVVINGQNFGDSREIGLSYVEISGIKLTSSAYLSWADSQIKIVLPANIQDGLLIVGTKEMKSNPVFFANIKDIPQLVPESQQVSKPIINELSAEMLAVGQTLTIRGSNFGEIRNQAKVMFSADYNNRLKSAEFITSNMLTENMVEVSEEEAGYISWNSSEIKVKVPDGAYSGVVIVTNGKEKSDAFPFKVSQVSGTKEFINKKQFLIQYEVNVRDVLSNDDGTLTLRCPVPEVYPSQPFVQMTEISPAPALKNYQKCNVQQLETNRNNIFRENYSQIFIVDSYETKTSVKADKIGLLKDNTKAFIDKATGDDGIVNCSDSKIVTLASQIVGREANQYKKAKLIYDYMCKNFEILSKPRKDDADPMDLISKKKGDAYDYAIIYASLLRATGIACKVDAGILINQNLRTQTHWWNEIYLQNFGWLPVDVALGDGMDWKAWSTDIKVNEYYFGNLDNSHICFSRNQNELKVFAQDNSVVSYKRSFALQNIWEESSTTVTKYSAIWNTPLVKGVYN